MITPIDSLKSIYASSVSRVNLISPISNTRTARADALRRSQMQYGHLQENKMDFVLQSFIDKLDKNQKSITQNQSLMKSLGALRKLSEQIRSELSNIKRSSPLFKV